MGNCIECLGQIKKKSSYKATLIYRASPGLSSREKRQFTTGPPSEPILLCWNDRMNRTITVKLSRHNPFKDPGQDGQNRDGSIIRGIGLRSLTLPNSRHIRSLPF